MWVLSYNNCQCSRDKDNCMKEKRVKEIGFIEKGTGKHQSNVVISMGGCCPCLCASLGYKQPPTLIVVRNNNANNKN